MAAFLPPTALALSSFPSLKSSTPPHTHRPVCTATNPSANTNPTTTTTDIPPRLPAKQPSARVRILLEAATRLERLTRPGVPSSTAQYDALPPHVKTPSQMLGRLSPGCEGTRAVFPKCNFSCHPCYHSENSNTVRTDGHHTVTEVARQMQTLQKLRGASAHCQLIGGEVSLLPPEDHALALQVMRFYGRIPMSFTHGEFDDDYLRRLALTPNGRPRFSRLDFAVHFDTGMRGRRGTPRLTEEADLTPARTRFVEMFRRLRRDHGVSYYLAHNMTVTSANLPTLAPAIADLVTLGFRLISFQPAAAQGDESRRVAHAGQRGDDGDAVWRCIEEGIGIRLSYSLFQMGDPRCNRMAVCAVVGEGRKDERPVHVFQLFDDECPADVRARDHVMRHVGNIVLPPRILFLKVIRVFLTKPWLFIPLVSWLFRIIRRANGVWPILRYGIHPLTVVMHRFMDADDVNAAWSLMERGVPADDPNVEAQGPRIRETMERLASCSYSMAHPDDDRLVPACVQHSVYDPMDNVRLAEELPLSQPPRPACDADLESSPNCA